VRYDAFIHQDFVEQALIEENLRPLRLKGAQASPEVMRVDNRAEVFFDRQDFCDLAADESLKAADIEPSFPGMLETIVIADFIVVLPVIKDRYFHKPGGCFNAHIPPPAVPEKYKFRSMEG
jgi:hypothetical protein